MNIDRKTYVNIGGRNFRRSRLLLAALMIVCLLLLAAVSVAAALSFRSELKASAYAARDDIKAYADCVMGQDAAGAQTMAARLETDADLLEGLLDSPMGKLAGLLPSLRADMKMLHKLASILGDTTRALLRPFASLMEEQPLSALRTPEGELDFASAGNYLTFVADREDTLLDLSRDLEELSAMPCNRLAPYIADKQAAIGALGRTLPLALDLTRELLIPGAALLRDCPPSALSTEDGGISVETALRYLDFAEGKAPYIREKLEQIEALELDELLSGESYQSYFARVESLLNAWDEVESYVPLARAFLGGGEDRLYVFAAQNSSEIRASGGFPGSVGTIRVQNGVLRIGDFLPVNSVLSFYKTADTTITATESKLFGDWFYAPRDADFCPDFERVGEIWASAYTALNGERVNGVVSATPVIIQRLLSVVGEVSLSDGTVLDGTNAARMLEYEMYYRYFSYGSSSDEGNEISDALFAETANKVMDMAVGQFSLEKAVGLFSVMRESAADRTLMLWMKDEAEQKLVRAAGLDCGLNTDPARPAAGIFFSLTNPSRMGWFLDMDPSVELMEEHEDGSKTYAVRLEMRNVMTEQELQAASWYISGSGARGTVTGYLYLFAPAGGSISEVSCTDKKSVFLSADYHGLDLRYTHQIYIGPGGSAVMEYTITTAPCKQADLVLSSTPTLQAYR